MRRAAWLLATALVASGPALAVVDPTAGPKDGRVRSTPYDPQQVVRITSTGLTPVQVLLEAGEKATGFAGVLVAKDPKAATDWYARDSGNAIVFQPLREMDPSVVFLNTVSADGEDRHYAFELVTRKGDITDVGDQAAYMLVQFTYKAKPDPAALAAQAARAAAWRADQAERDVKAKLELAKLNAPRNYNYSKRGDAGCPVLAPQYVYDDGHKTTLVFPPNATLPAVYWLTPKGEPTRVTTINETLPTGLEVVLPFVKQDLKLARGDDSLACLLHNNAFDPVGTQPGGGTGTVAPDVVRQVRSGPADETRKISTR